MAITILLSLLAAFLDYKAWRQVGSSKVVALLFILLNILPYIATVAMFFASDNVSWLMALGSWCFTVYVTLTLARLALYFGIWVVQSRVVGALLAAMVILYLGYSALYTRTELTLRRVEVVSDALPEAFGGFRILFFSDLHIGSLVNRERELSALVEAVVEQKADMVLFGGDLTHIRHTELDSAVRATLSKITAPYGVYAVLGNHDTGTYIKDSTTLPRSSNIEHLCRAIGSMGWKTLRDSTIYAVKCQDSIAVTGIDYSDALLEYKHSRFSPDNFSAAEIFADVPRDMFNIAISHLPQLWGQIADAGATELTLAGHVHAMQIAVPLFGRRLSPAKLMYKHWSGMYSNGGHHLYITDGVGCVGFNMRIGAVPEVTLIELNR